MSYALNQFTGFGAPSAAGGVTVRAADVDWDFINTESLADATATYTFSHTRATTGAGAAYFDSNGDIARAATGVVRYCYDPSGTPAKVGMICEHELLNQMARGEEVGNATVWGAFSATVSANAAVAPDGNTTADKIIPTATTADHYYQNNTGFSTGSIGGYATQGVYVKGIPGEVMYCVLEFYFGAGNRPKIWVDLSDGTITDQQGGTMVAYGTQAMQDDWYYVWAHATTVTSKGIQMYIHASSGGTSGDESYLGDNIQGFYAWGCNGMSDKRSLGFYRGPIAGADATQPLDVYKVATSGWMDYTEGTLLCEFHQFGWQSVWAAYLATFRPDAGSATDYMALYANGHTPDAHALMEVSNVQQFNMGTPSGTTGGPGTYKAALAYKLNDCQIAANGVALTADTVCTLPSSANLAYLYLGQGWNTTPLARAGFQMQRVRYWNTRLTEAELVAITT